MSDSLPSWHLQHSSETQACPSCALELDTDSCGPSSSRRRWGSSGGGSVLARGLSGSRVTQCLAGLRWGSPALQQLQGRGAPQPGQGLRGGSGLARGTSAFS